ncbi:uncharacterized protein SAZU_7812 [Streptomyces azureus]|uniref:Uncharacterized protein n=1 Tax=Streptomyces azureus TaxID=146537 RepID=A0A0K8PYY7_STRAJ|nr:uncharacterized protein SAZU_7812 [Streptomyces azureus]
MGLVGGVDPLHQDLHLTAAGQAHGEGVVIGVAEPGPYRGFARLQYLLAQFVDGPFHASSGDAADRLAVGSHGQCGAGWQGCAAADLDDGGEGEGAGLAAPAVQRVRDVQHEWLSWGRLGGPPPCRHGGMGRHGGGPISGTVLGTPPG